MANKVQLKRVYDQANKQDGTRFLVERVWPRGRNEISSSGCSMVARCGSQPGVA